MIGFAGIALMLASGGAIPSPHSTDWASAVKVEAKRSDGCDLDAPYDRQNPFARILRGELPASTIYQDQTLAAFLPLDTNHPGEVLIITRRPVRDLRQMTDEELLAVMHLAKRIAVAQERALGATGYTIEENNGQTQGVCHVHFHVVPNTLKESSAPTRSDLDKMAARLKAALP